MPVELPPRLLEAIASDLGAQVTVVVGAGCSHEPPTSLPLSRELSLDAHAELVANRVLREGACLTPEDLSSLAEAVCEAAGCQEPLVRVLPRSKFRSAEPNRGYRKAAALLREGAIGDVITLNFDLALSNAVADLGGSDVAIIAGPEFHADLARANVIYLHRNANNPNPEEWILTRKAMSDAWVTAAWEAVITRRSAATPVVLFAGLGSPAAVLEHSVREIREAVQNAVFLAEPGDPAASPFRAALGIEPESVISAGWVDLMDALAERVAVKQRRAVLQSCEARDNQEGWGIPQWNAVRSFLDDLDLLDLGRLRANWTLQPSKYIPVTPDIAEQLAELFAVLELLIQATAFELILQSNGAVTVSDGDGRLRGILGFVSGRGARSAFAIEAEIENHRKYGAQGASPTKYIATGVSGTLRRASAPEDIATGGSEDDLIGGWGEWSIVLAEEVCRGGCVEELMA